MDYFKTYTTFITSRKERVVVGYYEKHHIIPKSINGTDEESNLIKLSARDHAFAHLLLAKIYGGPLLLPVILMGNKKTRLTAKLKEQAAAYQSKQRKGKPVHLNTKRVLCTSTGKVWHSSAEAAYHLNISRVCIERVCDHTRRSTHGLVFEWETTPSSLHQPTDVIPHYSKPCMCTKSGKCFTSIREAAAFYGMDKTNVRRSCEGKRKHCRFKYI